MTEMSIIVPLSVLGEAKDLTPQGISEALQKAGDQSARVEQLEQIIDAMKQNFIGFANDVAEALDSDTDPFNKFRKLRELSGEMKRITKNV